MCEGRGSGCVGPGSVPAGSRRFGMNEQRDRCAASGGSQEDSPGRRQRGALHATAVGEGTAAADLCSLPGAAVSHDHRPMFSYSLGVRNREWLPLGQAKVSQGWSLWWLQRRTVRLPLPDSNSARIPGLAALRHSTLCFHRHNPSSDSDLLPPSYKDPAVAGDPPG